MADGLLDAVLAEASAGLGSLLGEPSLDLATEARVRDLLAEIVNRIDRRSAAAGGVPLGFAGREELVQRAHDEIFGMGAMQAHADDPATTELVVTGPHDGFCCRAGIWYRFDPGYASEAALQEWVRRFAERHGHHVDHASPEVDFPIANPRGRFHVVIPPVARSTQISVRALRMVGEDLADLVDLGTLTEPAAELLAATVAAKLNVLLSGGGSTGKTTAANALGRAIPSWERVVTIEDLAELQLADHLEKCSALYTRRPNIEGKGGRSIEDLIPMALRMCADRIVVGEIRGREAAQVIDVMNTGHEGSITTIHANSATDALDRLVTLVGNAGWSYEFAVRRVAQTVAFVVHMRKLPGGKRVVDSITEVDGAERSGVIRCSEIFTREGDALMYRNRPRQDRYQRLAEAGWQPSTAARMEVGQWR